MGTFCTTREKDNTGTWALKVVRTLSGGWWEKTRHAVADVEKALCEPAPKLMNA